MPKMMMSGKIISYILAALLQACLLDARSLRGPRQSTISEGSFIENDIDHEITKPTTNTVTDSLCLPSEDQLQFYSQLHNTTAINGLGVNTLYYTLTAMEAHYNRTVSTTTAAEDNAAIASVSDQSRFAPAGMETTSKVVCAQILQKLDAEASIISNTAVCPWDYICDYRADRFPHYLFKARCKNSICSGNCSPKDNRHNQCQSHGFHVTVLQMRNCGEWDWGQELLPIACTCTNNVMMSS